MAILLDSYSESNQDDYWQLYTGVYLYVGQSFTTPNDGNSYTLDSCKFYLSKEVSSSELTYAKLYAHTGTYGTSSKPTGSALATSDSIPVSAINYGTFSLITFTFSGANRITLSPNTHYVIMFFLNAIGDYLSEVDFGVDDSSPTASGNPSYGDGSTWFSYDTGDAIFYVYGVLGGGGTVYTMVTAPASFTFTPQSSGNPVNRNMPTSPASFILTGMAATFTNIAQPVIYYMITAPAQFILTGQQVFFNKFKKAINRYFGTDY